MPLTSRSKWAINILGLEDGTELTLRRGRKMDSQNLMYLAIILVGGIGYWIASGAARADYKAFHVVIGMAWFSIIGFLSYQIFLCLSAHYLVAVPAILVAIPASLIVVMILAFIWRRYLSGWVFEVFRYFNITYTPFGPSETWDAIENIRGFSFHHIRVFLSDGSMLGSNQGEIVEAIKSLPDKSLPKKNLETQVFSDNRGNIAFFVTEIKEANCKERREVSPIHDGGTIELTYIPAGKIDKILVYLGSNRKPSLIWSLCRRWWTWLRGWWTWLRGW